MINVQQGNVVDSTAKAIVISVTQDGALSGATAAVDQALEGAISQLIADGEVRGKEGELTLIHTLGRIPAPRVLVLGLGKAESFDLTTLRNGFAAAARLLRKAGANTIATVPLAAGGLGQDTAASAQAIVEGAILGLYTFSRHKKRDEDEREIEELTIIESDAAKLEAVRAGAEKGRILAEATNRARDLANEPANYLTPTELASQARSLAEEVGLTCRVLERKDMEELGMNALLGVAKGSHEPPKLIVVEYRGAGEGAPTLGLVGKGITFDTGGISIKPAQGMQEMKGDMAGAAAVISAMGAIARLKPKVNVTALAPATENMPGGGAQRPGDVVRAMNGKTIEVVNTDAEGRLILADALAYARRLNLSPVIDVATLTGAIIIALGRATMGAMTNNAALLDRVRSAAAAAGEKLWELPLLDEYKEHIKSEVADIKNVGNREAGSIIGGLFLKEFIEDTPWVHLDIAGVDLVEKEKGILVKGSSGIPVRTLVNLALSLAEQPLTSGAALE
ncbi:MAG: leucyl aminopeptidase [Dehalococcoidia bacterium]|nr:leucyl aminopeptidase [Dehalococcoidia bacterium]